MGASTVSTTRYLFVHCNGHHTIHECINHKIKSSASLLDVGGGVELQYVNLQCAVGECYE